MAWSGDFLTKIAESSIAPIYLLESIEMGIDAPIGGQLFLTSASSHRFPGYEGGLSPEGSSISSGLLNTGDWTFTVGQWEIGLDPGHGSSTRLPPVTRGQPVVLKVGFAGWDAADFQPVALGQLQNIIRRGEMWVIQVRSLLAGLGTRWTEEAEENALFFNMPLETFVTTADFTGGNTSVAVDNVTGAEKETGKGYILEITPDEGNPLYYYSPTLTVKTFSGMVLLFDGDINLPDGSAPKVASSHVAADEVVNVRIGCLIKGDPATVVRKMLLSTGLGTNGTFDTLPASFGLGLTEQNFDTTYFDFALSTMIATGASDDLYAHSFEPQEDALAFIQSVLAPFGAFLCERQGQISVSTMSGNDSPAVGNEWVLDDTEIVEIAAYEAWSSEQAAQTGLILNTAPSELNETEEGLGTFQVTTTRIDSHVTSRPNTIHHATHFPYVNGESEAEWLSETTVRTMEWYLEVGELVEVVCRGWRLAAAAPGDHLVILSGRITGREGFDSALGEGAACHIIKVDCNWFGATTRIVAVHLPIVSAAVDVP